MRYVRSAKLLIGIIFVFTQSMTAKSYKVDLPKITLDQKATKNKKSWTFIVYIAANNDLFELAFRDLEEMSKVGSNEHFNSRIEK
jgi:biopolymer transport protein ExbD